MKHTEFKRLMAQHQATPELIQSAVAYAHEHSTEYAKPDLAMIAGYIAGYRQSFTDINPTVEQLETELRILEATVQAQQLGQSLAAGATSLDDATKRPFFI